MLYIQLFSLESELEDMKKNNTISVGVEDINMSKVLDRGKN